LPFRARKTKIFRGHRPESSTAIQTVTSRLTARLRNQNATLPRVLSLLLVTFIFYGTTVEAAHCHAQVRSTTNTSSSLVDPLLASKLANSKTSCSECLICQLHQNFSATLISVSPSVNTSGLRTLCQRLDRVVIRSQTNTPRTGRAPPTAN